MDKFYTTSEIVTYCSNLYTANIDIDYDNDLIIEPSSGNGAFISTIKTLCKNYLFLDILPENPEIFKIDFLQFDYSVLLNKYRKIHVIGNPPFGKVSSMAIKFFNYASNFCDYIGFIIPRTFKRVSVQNTLNLNFHLIHNTDLPLKPCCFIPKMDAKCCFQIWSKQAINRNIIHYEKTHKDFIFLKHGAKDIHGQPTPPDNAHFALKAYGSKCGQIVDTNLMKLRPKSWHWIRSNINIDTLKWRFAQLDYSISKDTVRQDSLGQQELIFLYTSEFGK